MNNNLIHKIELLSINVNDNDFIQSINQKTQNISIYPQNQLGQFNIVQYQSNIPMQSYVPTQSYISNGQFEIIQCGSPIRASPTLDFCSDECSSIECDFEDGRFELNCASNFSYYKTDNYNQNITSDENIDSEFYSNNVQMF